jgi:hypothetical protein
MFAKADARACAGPLKPLTGAANETPCFARIVEKDSNHPQPTTV